VCMLCVLCVCYFSTLTEVLRLVLERPLSGWTKGVFEASAEWGNKLNELIGSLLKTY